MEKTDATHSSHLGSACADGNDAQAKQVGICSAGLSCSCAYGWSSKHVMRHVAQPLGQLAPAIQAGGPWQPWRSFACVPAAPHLGISGPLEAPRARPVVSGARRGAGTLANVSSPGAVWARALERNCARFSLASSVARTPLVWWRAS